MTEKLYYQDPYQKTFSAKIIKRAQDDDKELFVVLDQTDFYPTGGGQPYDTGVLNNIQVTRVEDIDGEIRHYLEEALPNTKQVIGEIDWDRRFDHMQQHAGQHILSAAFEEIFGFKTVSFHLGNEICTIDLNVEDLKKEHLQKTERFANQVIIENRPIETRWVGEDEVRNYPLRKQLSVTANIRLVIIPELDYNGCGGTHPNTTGQVVAIKILNWEKQRKNVRVQFVCGNRVLKQLEQKQTVVRELARILSAPELEIPNAVGKLLENGKQKDRLLQEAKEALLTYEAKELLTGKNEQITAVFQNRSVKELQKLAQLVVAESEKTIIVLVSENENKLQLVCARGKARNDSMKNLIKEILPIINGKGGGSDSIAQGGGEAPLSAEQFLEKIKEVMG